MPRRAELRAPPKSGCFCLHAAKFCSPRYGVIALSGAESIPCYGNQPLNNPGCETALFAQAVAARVNTFETPGSIIY